MTPRELEAAFHFAELDARHEAAEHMGQMGMATRGEPKALDKQMRDLARDDG